MTKTWTMMDIQTANRQAGFHWFAPSTKRFFRSRIGDTVYQGPGGVFFVSSEQFVPSTGRPANRCYTVRRFNPETFDISTVGPFNVMGRSEARTAARKLAAAPEPVNYLRLDGASEARS